MKWYFPCDLFLSTYSHRQATSWASHLNQSIHDKRVHTLAYDNKLLQVLCCNNTPHSSSKSNNNCVISSCFIFLSFPIQIIVVLNVYSHFEVIFLVRLNGFYSILLLLVSIQLFLVILITQKIAVTCHSICLGFCYWHFKTNKPHRKCVYNNLFPFHCLFSFLFFKFFYLILNSCDSFFNVPCL